MRACITTVVYRSDKNLGRMVFRKDKVSSFRVLRGKNDDLKFLAIFMDILCGRRNRVKRVLLKFSNKSAPKLGSSLLRIISLDLPLAASS